MHNKFEDIWKIFPKNAMRGHTWHWWWWLYFFKNPKRPEYPKQLMILWATRNSKKVRVNNFLWKPNISQEVSKNSSTFDGMVACWYYDGNKMHESFILECGITKTTWDKEHGSVVMKNENGTYSFKGKDADFVLKANNPKISIDIQMNHWTNEMDKLEYTNKVYQFNMGYTVLKYRGLLAKGKLCIEDSKTVLEGRAYFQKVRVSSLTPAWYWATGQSDSSAYIQYFIPYIGIPWLRQTYTHNSSLDWGKKKLSQSLEFYEPFKGINYNMKIVKFENRYENDLPIFKIEANSKNAKLEAEISAYSRACWHISQPIIWPIWWGIFYNEYPARLVKLKFIEGNRVLDKDDFGNWVCNCEHSWGTV